MDRSLQQRDETVIAIASASRLARVLTRPAEFVRTAWLASTPASLLERWRRVALATRIRSVAIMLLTAAVTHVALTRFGEPLPLTIVRAAWVVLMLLLATIAACAGPIAAAWRDRDERRRS